MTKLFVIVYIAFGGANNGQEINRDNIQVSEPTCRYVIEMYFRNHNRDKQTHVNWFATCREYRP